MPMPASPWTSTARTVEAGEDPVEQRGSFLRTTWGTFGRCRCCSTNRPQYQTVLKPPGCIYSRLPAA
jgi:hypothetical protein